MKMISHSSMLGTVLALGVCLLTGPAEAQLLFFVSVNGNDSAICSPQEPCRTFQRAHDHAFSRDSIVCLNSGSFSFVTITKSITIDCTGHNAHALFMNIQAPGARVTLRSISFDSLGTNFSGLDFSNGSSLHLENCSFANYTGGSVAAGLYFRPSGPARLYVTDSVFSNNGNPSNGGGIVIHPQGAGSALVTLNRVTLNGNSYGIFAQGLASSGAIVAEVRDSSVSGRTVHGIFAITDASPAAIVVERSSSVLSGGNGILAQGAGAMVHLGSSTVRGNATGLGVAGGGQILSFQDNKVAGNGVDGAPTGVLALK